MNPFFTHLECAHCLENHDHTVPQSTCQLCGGPLLARYNLDPEHLPSLDDVLARPAGQFRFHEVLPTAAGADTPNLGEGATPLITAGRLGVLVKDEAQNPTGSFKARGMAVAMARAVELGLSDFVVPSNGNAGGAAAAYAAHLGVKVEVIVPAATPSGLISEPETYGAKVTAIDGTIADAGREAAERAADGLFNLATLREPFRVEGKKLMGYELFWDLGGLPDVVVYPTGGGTGLIGMAKAFDEMQALGWIGSERPRMVTVQVEGCAPIVKAFHAGAEEAEPWPDPDMTVAYGLRVPSALGDRLMLKALRTTHGTAVAVSEADLIQGTDRLAREAGISGTPEGGACLAAVEKLNASGWIAPDEKVVIFNTAAAAKYV